MISFGYKKLILFSLLSGLIITGCSSSSNTIRYGSDNNSKEEKEKVVRYPKIDKKEPADNKTLTDNEENDMDDSPDDLSSVDISVINQKYHSMEGNSGISSEAATLKETMLMEIIKYINTPYKFGGNSRKGIDCSAFTQTIYSSCSVNLFRSAKEQYTQGVIINNKEDLRFGDLVFFNTRKNVRPGHVGIYLGDNLFVHASTKQGVIVTPLDHDYYQKRYMGARRIEEISGFQ